MGTHKHIQNCCPHHYLSFEFQDFKFISLNCVCQGRWFYLSLCSLCLSPKTSNPGPSTRFSSWGEGSCVDPGDLEAHDQIWDRCPGPPEHWDGQPEQKPSGEKLLPVWGAVDHAREKVTVWKPQSIVGACDCVISMPRTNSPQGRPIGSSHPRLVSRPLRPADHHCLIITTYYSGGLKTERGDS